MSNIFEKASRDKVRFTTTQGTMTVEDLWDLPLSSEKPNRASLESIAVALHEVTTKAGVSFVKSARKPSAERDLAELQLEIVKHVIDVRETENAAKVDEAKKAAEKARIREILAQRKDKSLETLSDEQLQKLLET